jgi:hypothetical protein
MIQMGNDEFILHIRKRFQSCEMTNDQIGKAIWQWLRDNDENARIVERDEPCRWGNFPEITSERALPKTATQFRFSIETLPRLYRFIGDLATR